MIPHPNISTTYSIIYQSVLPKSKIGPGSHSFSLLLCSWHASEILSRLPGHTVSWFYPPVNSYNPGFPFLFLTTLLCNFPSLPFQTSSIYCERRVKEVRNPTVKECERGRNVPPGSALSGCLLDRDFASRYGKQHNKNVKRKKPGIFRHCSWAPSPLLSFLGNRPYWKHFPYGELWAGVFSGPQ